MPARLTGEAAVVEELLLRRRGHAAEDRVAMRETAEAANNIGVDLGPFQAIGIARRFVKRQAAFLILHVFRMLERQIEEAAQVGEGAVEAVENGAAGDGTCQRIGGESPRLSAKHVARKLVEQDEESERALRACFPFGQVAGGRG